MSYSTWDSPDDAEEFASIIGAAIAKATGLEQNGRRIGDRYVIGHKGSDVAVLIDAKGDVDATIDRLFATTKKSEVVPKGQKKSEDGGK